MLTAEEVPQHDGEADHGGGRHDVGHDVHDADAHVGEQHQVKPHVQPAGVEGRAEAAAAGVTPLRHGRRG